MPVRVSKPVSKYLDAQIRQRIGLLESALIELHDIDNRMKMELLALNSMLEVDDDDDFSLDTITPVPVESDFFKNPVCADGSYELIDLNDELSSCKSFSKTVIHNPNSTDISTKSHHASHLSTNLNKNVVPTFHYLSNLVNDNFLNVSFKDQSLNCFSHKPIHDVVDIDHSEESSSNK